MKAIQHWASKGFTAPPRKCWYNDGKSILSEDPEFETQDGTSCDTTTSDDACIACAKAACCSEYGACAADANCVCLVGCLYVGNTVTACTSPDVCGPADAISTATAACLNGACQAECVNSMGSTSACACGNSTSSGSSSSSGAPPCTPGSFGAGDPCFSDGDCASCSCDAQTQTCD